MEKRTRVGAVIRHPVGGIRTYLKYTYGNLNKERYRFTIVTVEDTEGRLLEHDLKDLNIEVIRTGGRWRIVLMIWNVFRLCGLNRVEVIHSQGMTAGLLALLGNCFRMVPHIVTSHDILRKEQFRGWSGVVKKWLLGLALRRADVIHCVSEDVRQNLLEFLPALARQEAKCVVIANGVAVRGVQDETSDGCRMLRQQLGLGQDRIIFGFFGRFMPQKGFECLIDAVCEVSRDREMSGRFKVLAVNDGAFIREYKAIIRRKGLQEWFAFHGFTPDIWPILKELDAVVIPSLWEASSLVAMEAFIAGCPVIASECIGLREVVRGTPAVKVTSGDVHALAKSLAQVVRDPESYKRGALEFVPFARQRFDVSRSAAELDSLFQRLSKA